MKKIVYKVGTKGQVVIPRRLREECRIRPGDEVSFQKLPDGTINVRPQAKAGELLGMLASDDGWTMADYEAEKHEERELEEQKARRLMEMGS